MKIFSGFFLLLVVFLFACTPKEEIAQINAQTDPTAEIEQAVKDFLSKPQQSPFDTTKTFPPRKVLGITLHKQTDTFYIVGADSEIEGKRETFEVFCRKYTSDGKSYWKAEPYDFRMTEILRKK